MPPQGACHQGNCPHCVPAGMGTSAICALFDIKSLEKDTFTKSNCTSWNMNCASLKNLMMPGFPGAVEVGPTPVIGQYRTATAIGCSMAVKEPPLMSQLMIFVTVICV